MTAREEVLAYALSFADVYTERPFRDQNWQLVRIKGSKKTFLWIYDRGGYLNLNVKVAPEWRDFWRNTYPAVVAGYHQNKMHWNTIILDGTIPTQDIKRMIAESYDLIADSPTKRIYEAVKKIPKGCVATYGMIAALAGDPNMARAVGNALHKNPDPANIPCYRVVNAKGSQRKGRFGKISMEIQIGRKKGVIKFITPFFFYSSSSFSTDINAFCGTSTLPIWRIRFFPSFCFSSSFFLREISPP